MIIMNMHGMLGNQLFQYAYATQLSKQWKQPFLLNTEFLPKNGYRLDKVGLKADHGSVKRCLPHYLCLFHAKLHSKAGKWLNIVFQTKRRIQDVQIKQYKNYYFEGYWQGIPYVEEALSEMRKVIKEHLQTCGNKECQAMAEDMQSHPNSVMVHVRRGDYLTTQGARNLYCNIPSEYYQNAVERLQKMYGNVKLYIFTNDKKWVRDNMPCLVEGIIVECDKEDYETLKLMTKCKHSIIANSTLSWWAAQLKEPGNHTVIAPKQWFCNEDVNPHQLYPDEWIKM